jgi:EAL domain-containing protein (putative c-di-GMP-specific phosphodiesterase class I)
MSQLLQKTSAWTTEYDPDETLASYGQLHWIHRIHRAFEERRFRLYRRPVEPLAGSGLRPLVQVGLRMLDGSGSAVDPGLFVAMAERYRLVSSLDRWVVKTALRALGAVGRSEGGRGLAFSLPLSSQSLVEDGFLAFVFEELERSTLDPRRVCFEIAEVPSSCRKELHHAVSVLRGEGCRFVFRGGGGGLDTFNLLRELEVDFLEIDGELIQGMLVDPVRRILVDAANRIGHLVGVATVAERVDHPDLLKVVAQLGVDYAVGDCLSPPQPLVHEV